MNNILDGVFFSHWQIFYVKSVNGLLSFFLATPSQQNSDTHTCHVSQQIKKYLFLIQ